MTPPVPHRGLQVRGMALVENAKRLLEQALVQDGLGAETEIGQAILKSLQMLGKAIPEGSATPGLERAGMEQFMLQQRQGNPLNSIIAALKQQGGGGQPQPAPPPM